MISISFLAERPQSAQRELELKDLILAIPRRMASQLPVKRAPKIEKIVKGECIEALKRFARADLKGDQDSLTNDPSASLNEHPGLDSVLPSSNNQTMQRRLAASLKRLRRNEGLTQERLAKKARLTLGYVARLEIGYHDPKLSTLTKLAKALKVKVAELVE